MKFTDIKRLRRQLPNGCHWRAVITHFILNIEDFTDGEYRFLESGIVDNHLNFNEVFLAEEMTFKLTGWNGQRGGKRTYYFLKDVRKEVVNFFTQKWERTI